MKDLLSITGSLTNQKIQEIVFAKYATVGVMGTLLRSLVQYQNGILNFISVKLNFICMTSI